MTSAEETRTSGQKANLLERRGVLLRRIKKWRRLQAVYMPGALDIDPSDPGSLPSRAKAESVKLWLPSQLDPEDRNSICSEGVVKSEKELRFGQLEDSLNDLRRVRRIRHGMATFHKVQLAGEGVKTQTRSRAVVQTIQDRIAKCARRYRVARGALLHLDPQGSWKSLYLPLAEGDNRGPGKEPDEKLSSDGRYAPSWIWYSSTTTISPDEVNEDMRMEWAQCVARADRWEEEMILLQEEMRRVVEFLEWRSRDWFTKVDSRIGTTTPAVRAGLSAYANKQGSIFHHLAIRFSQRWRSALLSLSLPHAWATTFLKTHGKPLNNPDFKKRKKAKGTPAVHTTQVASPPVVTTQVASPPVVTTRVTAPPPITTRVASPPPIATRVASPSPITTPVDVPPLTTPGTINHEAEVSDSDSDETSSECDGSGYESSSSWSE